MGLLMFAGLIGTMAYGMYFAKQETTAIIGDTTIQPKKTINEDKQLIAKNFKLICKRGNAKLDNNGNPKYKNHYKPCLAYLQYQGFRPPAVEYFEQLYLEKYNKKYKDKIQEIQLKHNDLDRQYFAEYNNRETKIFRHWYSGDTEKKCQKMMRNLLWGHLVDHYNIVSDGGSDVEVWSISAPPSILKQLDSIYDEVCLLEGIYKY